MPKQLVGQRVLTLHKNFLVRGRKVKTKTFSGRLINSFTESGLSREVQAPDREIKGWCNLNFLVNKVLNDKVVLLSYANGAMVEWPIAGLSTAFGIRI